MFSFSLFILLTESYFWQPMIGAKSSSWSDSFLSTVSAMVTTHPSLISHLKQHPNKKHTNELWSHTRKPCVICSHIGTNCLLLPRQTAPLFPHYNFPAPVVFHRLKHTPLVEGTNVREPEKGSEALGNEKREK